jgi:hypothetical protein
VTVCVGRGDFAEPVLARGLEVERGQAVEDQREPAAPAGGVGLAGIRDDVAVLRSTIRRRQRCEVARDGAPTPTSVSTRTVPTLLVGSMIRPSTSARNASSRTAENPNAS